MPSHFSFSEYHGGGDFQEIVNRYVPDLIVFKSGIELTNHDISIINIPEDSDIPRIAYCSHDIHSPARHPFFQWCDKELNVDAIFCDYLAGIEDSYGNSFSPIYMMPRYRNRLRCQDYGELKTVSLAMLGHGFISCIKRYPWRRQAYLKLSPRFPVVTSPRPRQGVHSLIGENYGRMLNRSLMAFGCGGIHDAPLLKLFEIPSCRTCLVCPPSKILKLYGFEDMKNCVMAEEGEILYKVTYLMEHRDKLEEITDAGYHHMQGEVFDHDFVAIAQWYNLWRQKRDDEVIVQHSLLGPLGLAPKGSNVLSSSFPHSPIIYVLHNALNLVYSGKITEAVPTFRRALEAVPYFPEANFGFGLIGLKQGSVQDVYNLFLQTIQFCAQSGFTTMQDPIIWAYFLIAAANMGLLSEALQVDAHMAHLRHPCLEASRYHLRRIRSGGSTPVPAWTDEMTMPSFIPDPFKTAECWHTFNEQVLNLTK